MRELVLASGNAGKAREFAALLEGSTFTLRLQSEWAVPEVEETGLSFVENALLKARHAARLTGLPAVADDSGLVVDALGGAPGIHSARYAGVGASDADNVQKLLAALSGEPEAARTCRFVCVLTLLRSATDPTPLIAEGRWEGRVALAPAGDNGFGYDPVFLVPEDHCTAAQLPSLRKHDLSHRGQALRALVNQLKLAL